MKHFVAWLGITIAWDALAALTASPAFWRGDGAPLVMIGWPLLCGMGWLGILVVARMWRALRNAAAPRQIVLQQPLPETPKRARSPLSY